MNKKDLLQLAKSYKCLGAVKAAIEAGDLIEAQRVLEDKRTKKAAYRAANKDKIAAYQAAYRAANKDNIAAYQAAYQAAYHKKNYAENYSKNKQLAERLHGTHCQICGSNRCVDWAHIEGNKTKVNDVAPLYSLPTPDAWQAEAAKCVRLCRSCHMKYDGNWAKDHGQSRTSLNKFSEAVRGGTM